MAKTPAKPASTKKRPGRGRRTAKLTAQAKRFATLCIAYGDGRRPEAFRDAGYKAKARKQAAYHLYHSAPVQEELARQRAALQDKAEITAERVLRELAAIGFANAGDFFEWGPGGITIRDKDELTREQQAVVAEVSQTKTESGGTIRVKLHDKLGALEKLGRNLGLFVEKHEHSGPGGGPIPVAKAEVSFDELMKEYERVRAGEAAPSDPARG